jgi:hypothetical protein
LSIQVVAAAAAACTSSACALTNTMMFLLAFIGDIREIVGQPVFVPLYNLFLRYGKIFKLR